VNPFIPPSFIMFSFSLFTLFLVSLQRGLTLIFYNNPLRTTSTKMLRLILKTLGKTVLKHKKGVFKCIWVVYKFSTMLLKRGCNTVDKVQVWTKSTCGKLLLMPWRIGVEKHYICSDLREQSITLSPLNVNTLIYIL